MDDPAEQFVKLWIQFQPEIKRYVFLLLPRKADADDVLQTAASRLWEKFSEYDQERSFVSWATGFTYLEILKWRQRQARERLVFSDNLLAKIDSRVEEELPQAESQRKALDECLQKLSEQDRNMLLRCHGKHGAVKQEAERTNTTARKLYYWVGRIRMGLLKCINDSLATKGESND